MTTGTDPAPQNDNDARTYDAGAPDISVIVPIYRQWSLLPDLLTALDTQDFPLQQRGEVLLIDNDPADDAWRPPLPSWTKLLPCVAPGAYAARNLGAAAARGRLLIFTDADCRPQKEWLSRLLAAHRAESAANRKGTLLAGPVTIPLPEAASVWQIFDAVRGIPQEHFVSRGYAATANLAVPREVFEDLSGFDPLRMSGGDAEFCRRAGRRGYPLRFIPDAVVMHPARDGFQSLALKARRIKGGQIASGSRRGRFFWTLRSIVPPVRESVHYLRSGYAFRHRLIAIGVRFLLWAIELQEMMRLLLFRVKPERQ